ncbi:MAG TPA: VanZ family protein [Candidatus Limnocylindria bacterium]
MSRSTLVRARWRRRMGLDRGFAASAVGAALLVICWTGMVVVLSSLPHLDDDAGGRRFAIGIFVLGHAAFFSTLGFLVANLLAGSTHRLIWWTFVVVTVFAVFDELHQNFVPGRDPSPVDLTFDAMGALLGATVFLSLAVWRRTVARADANGRASDPGPASKRGESIRRSTRPDATGK